MKTRVEKAVVACWEAQQSLLQEKVTAACQQLEDIVRLEEHYRDAPKDQKMMQQAYGSFGSNTLNLGAISSSLTSTYDARIMDKARFRRVKALAKSLNELKSSWEKSPPQPTVTDLKAGGGKVLEAFETHIQPVAQAYSLMRKAGLEAKGRYQAKEHDEFFKSFDWRELNDEEVSLSPPFVVMTEREADNTAQLGDLLDIAHSGKPIKTILLRKSFFDKLEESGRATAQRGTTDLSLLLISLRSIYFEQGAPTDDDGLQALLTQGLRAPRAAFFSLLAGINQKSWDPSQAESALRSRAFPQITYNPDISQDFVSCLKLDNNPAPDQAWPQMVLDFETDIGVKAQQTGAYTFADFASSLPEFKSQFSKLPEEKTEEALPLAEYLDATGETRHHRTPFIYALNGSKRLQQLVPSKAVIAQCADQQHLWRTLQELAGIRNPHVEAAQAKLRDQLTVEQQAAMDAYKQEMEEKVQTQAQEAVAAAMKNLALRLTGMTSAEGLTAAVIPAPASIAPSADTIAAQQPAPAKPAVAPAPQPAAAPSERPWIEQRLCTTCDECTTLNKKIFAYDDKKKAYIKDPLGGPFKDLVVAAEKCASEAIHPGMPLNPDEKDLDKWMKRAERFQ